MPIPENWWSCDHPEESIVLLENKNTDGVFYACNNCGLAEGEADLSRSLVNQRINPDA